MAQTKEQCKTTSFEDWAKLSTKVNSPCQFKYKQDADSDWYECKVCGKIVDLEYVP